MATILREVSINPRGKGAARWSKLSEDDLELIELLKIEKPSVSLAEIISCLEEMDGVDVTCQWLRFRERSSRDYHRVLTQEKNYADRL